MMEFVHFDLEGNELARFTENSGLLYYELEFMGSDYYLMLEKKTGIPNHVKVHQVVYDPDDELVRIVNTPYTVTGTTIMQGVAWDDNRIFVVRDKVAGPPGSVFETLEAVDSDGNRSTFNFEPSTRTGYKGLCFNGKGFFSYNDVGSSGDLHFLEFVDGELKLSGIYTVGIKGILDLTMVDGEIVLLKDNGSDALLIKCQIVDGKLVVASNISVPLSNANGITFNGKDLIVSNP